MSLFQRIFILVSLLFLLLLGSLEASYVVRSRQYLQEQLTSHAQDVATSLGMVLPLSMKGNGNPLRLETTVDAVFERGYYSAIRIVSVDGRTVLLRQLPPAPPAVPAWFTRSVPLVAPSAESLITDGWRQLGRVIVTSSPNFAYLQLWNATVGATQLLVLFYLLSLVVLWAFLRTILRPLRDIERVAQDIGERNFTTVTQMPGARELRRVVEAINTLSGKIRAVIGLEVATAERYRVEAYLDPLTGFDNRRSFNHQLENSLVTHGGEAAVLYLVQIEGLDALNAAQGFDRGDALVQALANALASMSIGKEVLRARLGGATFAMLCWDIEQVAAHAFGQRLDQAVGAAIASTGAAEVSHGIGAVYVPHAAEGVSALLGEADTGVRQALAQTGSQHLVLIEHNAVAVDTLGANSWKHFIGNALTAGDIALWTQPVHAFVDPGTSATGSPRILQLEITGSLLDATGEVVPAARFLPMALRFGLMPALDRAFLHAIFEHYAQSQLDADTVQMAVNVSMQSLHDEALVGQVLAQLERLPKLARRLVFEFSEFGLVHDLDRAANVVSRLRQRGAEIAVDNFGFHPSAFQYLQRLRPAYIKLASSYLQDLEQHPENQFFIASVVRVARPLDIVTLACGVESDARLSMLQTLGVSGYQGYATARPERVS